MDITIVDSEGQMEDVGPFELEFSADERATLRDLAGKSYDEALDALHEMDDDRADPDMRALIRAFEEFGPTAELEVEE